MDEPSYQPTLIATWQATDHCSWAKSRCFKSLMRSFIAFKLLSTSQISSQPIWTHLKKWTVTSSGATQIPQAINQRRGGPRNPLGDHHCTLDFCISQRIPWALRFKANMPKLGLKMGEIGHLSKCFDINSFQDPRSPTSCQHCPRTHASNLGLISQPEKVGWVVHC